MQLGSLNQDERLDFGSWASAEAKHHPFFLVWEVICFYILQQNVADFLSNKKNNPFSPAICCNPSTWGPDDLGDIWESKATEVRRSKAWIRQSSTNEGPRDFSTNIMGGYSASVEGGKDSYLKFHG